MTLNELSLSIYKWSHHNFPMNTNRDPLLGLVEEWNMELIDAHFNGSYDDVKDAIADCTIYLLDYCARNQLDPERCITDSSTPYNVKHMHSPEERILFGSICIGTLSRIALKRHQQIRLEECSMDQLKYAAGQVFWILMEEGRSRGFDTLIITSQVWSDIVSKREWRKENDDE